MGLIRIETHGSFGPKTEVFTATEHGYAHAVAEAIQYLAEKVLPKAINNDHECHTDGELPSQGFKK